MGSLLRSIRSKRSIVTVDDYISAVNSFNFGGLHYPLGNVQNTMSGDSVPGTPTDLQAYAQLRETNGIVSAVMAVRRDVFSATRFTFQQFVKGRPSKLFGNPSLDLLNVPWPGGTTQDLLAQMIQDVDLAGNSYTARDGNELVRLRPDWVDVALTPRIIGGAQVGWRKVGYLYWEGGRQSTNNPAAFLVDEVAHFMPDPDPLVPWRGKTWMRAVVAEIQNDNLMNRHKRKFFENAATPNVIVRMEPTVTLEAFEKFKSAMDTSHRGVNNAYKTLYLGGAADVTVAGADFKQMDFKTVQGAGETRIAANAGVPPVVVGLSEGMQGSSLNAGNYGQARRNLADRTIHPLWQNAAGSMSVLVPPPDPAARLWYDSRDVPFLREDRKDIAEIQGKEAYTIRNLVDAGYTAESVLAAVQAEDWSLLLHSGLFSVQLQRPGITAPDAESNPPDLGGNDGGSAA